MSFGLTDHTEIVLGLGDKRFGQLAAIAALLQTVDPCAVHHATRVEAHVILGGLQKRDILGVGHAEQIAA